MADRALSAHETTAHLGELDKQECDARSALQRPESKPGVHKQLQRLIRRIAKEKAGLQKALSQLSGKGSGVQ